MEQEQPQVLIVDDQPRNLEVLAHVLGEAGYAVRAVTSGARAIEAARAATPDCVLMDVAMPEMDGFAACEALLALPGLESVPVIFLTAFDDQASKTAAFKSGGRDYVTKPFDGKEVLARVRVHCSVHQLERSLRERNGELTAANARVTELATQRARMSAMLVHDIRSPLTVIGGALDLPDDAELLDAARRSFAKIVRLIHELLALYKSDDVVEKPRRVQHDVRATVRGAVDVLTYSAHERAVQVVFANDPTPLDVPCDSDQLERVITNLLDNALKFTPAGGKVSVSVDTEMGAGPEAGLHFAVISVRDTGPGIPAADLPYIFDPYRQREQSADAGSVGLGLAIVQRLVAAQGGRVRVRSRVGVGSEFQVLLPTREL